MDEVDMHNWLYILPLSTEMHRRSWEILPSAIPSGPAVDHANGLSHGFSVTWDVIASRGSSIGTTFEEQRCVEGLTYFKMAGTYLMSKLGYMIC